MATVFGDEVKAAAKTLHIEGLKSAEIRERLMNGNAGLPYTAEPSERTVDKWRRSWEREGTRAGLMVRAGDETFVEDANYRRLLGLYRLKLSQLEELSVKGGTDLALSKEVTMLQSASDAARAKRITMKKRQEGIPLDKEEGGELTSGNVSMLDRLASEQEQTGHTSTQTIEGSSEGEGRDVLQAGISD